MDFVLYYNHLWIAGSVFVLCILLFIAYRSWSLIRWARILRKEIREIKEYTGNCETPREKAYSIIESKCRTILNSYSPEIKDYLDLQGYIKEIAACYFPDSENPELNVTVGNFLYSLEKSVQRFNQILSRKGLRSLSKINIRQTKTIYSNYKVITDKPFIKFYLTNRKRIRNISYLRFILLPDPFSILAFLSQNLIILLLTKYLMVDLYLFAGTLAVDVYDETVKTRVQITDTDSEIMETLEELSELNIEKSKAMPYKIADIRNSFLGVAAVLKKDPDLKQFKTAVVEAANVIGAKYFPDKEKPLEEAVIGPLVLKMGELVQTISKGEGVPIAGRLYNTRLSTLYQAKKLADLELPPTIETIIINAQKTYGWLKWPLKVYRIAKKISVWRISLEIGVTTGKKSALVYLYGRTFDKTVEELDDVYKMSKDSELWAQHFKKPENN